MQTLPPQSALSAIGGARGRRAVWGGWCKLGVVFEFLCGCMWMAHPARPDLRHLRHTYIYMHIHRYAYTYIHIHIHRYTYTYILVHTYTWTTDKVNPGPKGCMIYV